MLILSENLIILVFSVNKLHINSMVLCSTVVYKLSFTNCFIRKRLMHLCLILSTFFKHSCWLDFSHSSKYYKWQTSHFILFDIYSTSSCDIEPVSTVGLNWIPITSPHMTTRIKCILFIYYFVHREWNTLFTNSTDNEFTDSNHEDFFFRGH